MSESKHAACAAVSEHLVAYVDGELGRAELEAVQRHVATCLPCRREIESIKQIGQLVGAIARIEPSPDLAAGLQRRLVGTPAVTPLGTPHAMIRPPTRMMARVALAAAAAVTLALGSVLNQPAVPTGPLVSSRLIVAPKEASETVGTMPDPVQVAAAAATQPDVAGAAVAAANARSFGELMPKDLPPDLLERPELYLRLPVVRRLDTLEHFEAVRAHADRDQIGSAPRAVEGPWA